MVWLVSSLKYNDLTFPFYNNAFDENKFAMVFQVAS